jgi:hypothetical protein
MVHMRTSEFTQDVSEPSNTHAGAATNDLCNATRDFPATTSAAHEPRAVVGHAKRAHEGADEEFSVA